MIKIVFHLKSKIIAWSFHCEDIDWKQKFYDEVLSGKRPYVSNLIQPKEQTEDK